MTTLEEYKALENEILEAGAGFHTAMKRWRAVASERLRAQPKTWESLVAMVENEIKYFNAAEEEYLRVCRKYYSRKKALTKRVNLEYNARIPVGRFEVIVRGLTKGWFLWEYQSSKNTVVRTELDMDRMMAAKKAASPNEG